MGNYCISNQDGSSGNGGPTVYNTLTIGSPSSPSKLMITDNRLITKNNTIGGTIHSQFKTITIYVESPERIAYFENIQQNRPYQGCLLYSKTDDLQAGVANFGLRSDDGSVFQILVG